MQVTGGAAAHASEFAKSLRHTCVPGGNLSGVARDQQLPRLRGSATSVRAAASRGGRRQGDHGRRLGTLGDAASDDAIVALVDSAHTQAAVVLQDIGPVGKGADWPEPYLRSLVGAVGRGVDVQLVLSNIGAMPGGLMVGSASYSTADARDVIGQLAD